MTILFDANEATSGFFGHFAPGKIRCGEDVWLRIKGKKTKLFVAAYDGGHKFYIHTATVDQKEK